MFTKDQNPAPEASGLIPPQPIPSPLKHRDTTEGGSTMHGMGFGYWNRINRSEERCAKGRARPWVGALPLLRSVALESRDVG